MFKIIWAILFFIFLIPATAFAVPEAVPSNDLIDRAKDYDGYGISFTGEVIGDIMKRGNYAWMNISDGNNTIGVWVKSEDIEDITMVGRYNSHGDTIRVTGVFHRACVEHGGDFDIHAEKVEVVQKGYAVKHTINTMKAVFAGLLLIAVLICMGFIFQKKDIRE